MDTTCIAVTDLSSICRFCLWDCKNLNSTIISSDVVRDTLSELNYAQVSEVN